MAKKFRYKHISSVVEDRVPQSLLDGEIAVNRFAGKEKLFIKNSEGDIVPFIPEHEITVLSANVKTLAIATAEDINELSATTSELGEGISANTQNIEILSASTVEIESGLNQLSAATEDEIERLSASTVEIESGLNQLSAVTEDVNELSATVKTFIIAATEDIDELSATTEDISTLSGKVEELSAATTGISSNLSTLSGSVQTLSASTTGISSNLNTLSASTTGISSNLNTLSGSVQTLSASTTGISSNLNTLSGNVSTLSGNVSTVSGNVSTLSGNVSTISGNVQTLSGNVTTISGNVSTLSGNVDTLATAVVRDINELSGNVSTLSGSVVTFSGDTLIIINNLLQQIDSLKNYVNYHDYVEIGGVKWATMNIGATAITDTGLYYQWGDISGYTASQVGSGTGQKYFGWSDYKYGNGTSSPGATGMTKYNSTDGKTVLDLSDDAVNAAWGGNWRMPTIEEYVALGAAVNTAWTADYQGTGVAGLVCTDKTDSSKVLFFPAAGYANDGSMSNVGSRGGCWSSSLYGSLVQSARSLFFSSGNVSWQSNSYRMYGFSLRGVLGNTLEQLLASI